MSSISFDFDASDLIQSMENAAKQYPASAVYPVFPVKAPSIMSRNAL